jgi:hypothetical protein
MQIVGAGLDQCWLNWSIRIRRRFMEQFRALVSQTVGRQIHIAHTLFKMALINDFLTCRPQYSLIWTNFLLHEWINFVNVDKWELPLLQFGYLEGLACAEMSMACGCWRLDWILHLYIFVEWIAQLWGLACFSSDWISYATPWIGFRMLQLGLDFLCLRLDWVSYVWNWTGFCLLELGLDTGFYDWKLNGFR